MYLHYAEWEKFGTHRRWHLWCLQNPLTMSTGVPLQALSWYLQKKTTNPGDTLTLDLDFWPPGL